MSQVLRMEFKKRSATIIRRQTQLARTKNADINTEQKPVDNYRRHIRNTNKN